MEIQLPTIKVEAITPQFLYRSMFQLRGELFTFLNDRRYLTFHFMESAFSPLATGYRVSTLKQTGINVPWRNIIYIALLNNEDLAGIQLMQSSRPVTFYTRDVAIRGDLRVNLDAYENDLLDEQRDFFAVTDASILPLHSLAVTPASRVPLLALNRHQIESYHVYQPKES